MKWLRSIGVVLLCLVVNVVIVDSIEAFSGWLYPLPSNVSSGDVEAMKRYLAQLPASAFVLVLSGWMAGCLAAVWLAVRLANRRHIVHGLVVGLLTLTVAVVRTMAPHPLWFWFAAVASYVLATSAALTLGRPRTPPQSHSAPVQR